MKIDLVKSLRESAIFQKGLENIPENERESAQKKIEALMTEISSGFSSFAEQLQQISESDKAEVQRVVKEDDGLVIDETND